MSEISRHQCLIYQGAPSKHLGIIAPLIVERLQRRNRCLYLNSPAMVAGMRCSLWAAGVDVDSETKKRALIFSSDQGHVDNGEFSVEKMLASLQIALAQALADGYLGLFASGDRLGSSAAE